MIFYGFKETFNRILLCAVCLFVANMKYIFKRCVVKMCIYFYNTMTFRFFNFYLPNVSLLAVSF